MRAVKVFERVCVILSVAAAVFSVFQLYSHVETLHEPISAAIPVVRQGHHKPMLQVPKSPLVRRHHNVHADGANGSGGGNALADVEQSLPLASYEGLTGSGALLPGNLVRIESELRMNVVEQLSAEAKEKVKSDSMAAYQLNDYVSQRVPLDRKVPDTRVTACRGRQYDVSKLPTTSVIIAVYNEAPSVIIRTVVSVIRMTPPELLEEIIISDDASTNVDLLEGGPMEQFLMEFPQVRFVRATVRSGLMQSRMLGARAATGDVLTFLDCHCECNHQWIEPLLERVAADYRTVVMPIIDIIDWDTFAYTGITSTVHVGGLNWLMNMVWKVVSHQAAERAEPLPSATMAGGLFSIDRRWWFELGEYDPELEIWGGENMELSFKVWQCGGRLELIPCSRVGHVFRKTQHYKDANKRYLFNTRRVVETWLDAPHKEMFYSFRPAARDIDYGDISARVRLREELQCKSFEWFLDTVVPDFLQPKNVVKEGRLYSAVADQCVDYVAGNREDGHENIMYPCLWNSEAQHFVLSDAQRMHEAHKCMGVAMLGAAGHTVVKHYECSTPAWQKWEWDESKRQLLHVSTKHCLGVATKEKGGWDPVLLPCDTSDTHQQWKWVTAAEVKAGTHKT